MLFRTLMRLLERGQAEGMEEKLDIFFAANKLTLEEYEALLAVMVRQ